MTTSKTPSKRDQVIDLQLEMQEAENAALAQLAEILNSHPMQAAIAKMEALKDKMIPGGVGESQIKACIDIPRNVSSWLSIIMPLQRKDIALPPIAAE